MIRSARKNGFGFVINPFDNFRQFIRTNSKTDRILFPRADLPVTVHFIAEIPGSDGIWIGMSVLFSQIRPVCSAGANGILYQMHCTFYVLRSEVNRIHRFRICAHCPFDIFIMAGNIRFNLKPCKIKLGFSFFRRPY